MKEEMTPAWQARAEVLLSMFELTPSEREQMRPVVDASLVVLCKFLVKIREREAAA
jgi:hypothetical protein